jgi:uncharacterized protein (TIGR03118 family)
MTHHKKTKDIHEKFDKMYLTSDLPGVATYQDTNLISPWGMAIIDEIMWIANYGLITSYKLNGQLLYHVLIPNVSANVVTATALIKNETSGFVITNGPNTASCYLLVASKTGAIFGYNPFVDATNCITVIDNSVNNAVYTGLAIIGKYLCATDYNNNRIDVFDFNFNQVFTLPFTDLQVLDPLPVDVAPYNIVNINNLLYVVYTRQPDPTGIVEPSKEISYVSIFNKKGLFVKRFINKHLENSWAFNLVPHCFKVLKHKFLLGNIDGTISIFNKHGKKIGSIRDNNGCKLNVYGLNGMEIYNKKIYFTANPLSGYDDNPLLANHGIFGYIKHIDCHLHKHHHHH